jgi:hypothetical protein
VTTWATGGTVDRRELAGYLHLVRAPDDPERVRPKGGWDDKAPHRTLAKLPYAECERRLLAGLADGTPRTFNRLTMEVFNLTADVVFTTQVNDALWRLVGRGEIEHTTEVPILFRTTTRAYTQGA